MNRDLIIDVGMHIGKDTEFYLKKGFRVVGIEADPILVEKTKKRLSSYLADGRLTILNIAVNSFDGITSFYANRNHDDWGTLSSTFVQRNEKIYGSEHEKIEVQCTRFENILNKYGVPYYLKVDIEGLDILCLQALFSVEARPRYISIEPDQKSFEGASTELSYLWQLGYQEFKIVNQALNHTIKCPNPPLEGKYIEYSFNGLSSGPFGKETPGRWLTFEETISKYRKILKLQSLFGTQSGWQGKYCNTVFHKIYNIYLRKTNGEPLGWYDFHAKHGNDKKS